MTKNPAWIPLIYQALPQFIGTNVETPDQRVHRLRGHHEPLEEVGFLHMRRPPVGKRHPGAAMHAKSAKNRR